MNVTVVGAGVIGLTSAIRLREAGFEANIVAADLPVDTVASSVAGAIWYPYGSSAEAPEAGWGRRSLEVFTEAARAGLPGVALMDMVDLLAEPGPDPWWADRRSWLSPVRARRTCGRDTSTATCSRPRSSMSCPTSATWANGSSSSVGRSSMNGSSAARGR